LLTEPSAVDRSVVEIDYARPKSHRPGTVLIVIIALLPIAIATGVSIYYSAWSLAHRLTMPYPQNPWESAILADAYRAAHGERVYERPGRNGHATHLYGPLVSQTLGTIFRVTGPSLYTGRVVNLISSLLVCAIVVWIFGERRWFDLFVAAGLMLALHYRARAYFVETRPDMTACLLATLAIICFSRANRGVELKPLWYLPGIALVMLAFGFKQTYAAAAGVPLVAMIVVRPPRLFLRVLVAVLPLVAMVVLLTLMKLVTPVVFLYTITEPAMYRVSPERLALAATNLLTLSPLFLLFAGWWLIGRHPVAKVEREMSPAVMWLVAAVIVGAAAGIPAYAKRGGSYNSLLLGWVPMTAFCVAMLGGVLRRLIEFASRGDERIVPALGPGLTSIVGGWLIGGSILIMTFCVPRSDLWNWIGAHGGSEYGEVVEATKKLSGRILSPDDPTITMFAKDQVGPSLEAELDANGRTGFSPRLISDLHKSDWVITVHSTYDDRRFSAEVMSDYGFRRVKEKPFDRTYGLWQRLKHRPATTQTRTSD
jgi:hypothetical protein